MPKKNDTFLDGLMKGIGRQLGKRRKDVHDAIDRFHEELDAPEDTTEVETSSPNTQATVTHDEDSQDEGRSIPDEA